MLLITRSTGDRLFKFINIDDLEQLKKRVLVNFLQFLDAAHIATLNWTKWLEIDQDNVRMKFSALNVNDLEPQ